MNNSYIIGIDLGKNSFHLVGHDQAGHQLFKKAYSPEVTKFLSFHKPVIIVM